MQHFNGLMPGELERLAYLNEELHEVGQIIGKILRHGYESYNPTVNEWPRTTNRQLLERELGDVMRAVAMLTKNGDVNEDSILKVAEKGPPSKYMHHQDATK